MNVERIRPLEPSMPVDLATAYAAAQAKLRMSPGAHYSDLYHPLAQMVEQGKRWGGAHAAAALDACQEIAAADEPTIARMVVLQRPSPSIPNGVERADARGASMIQASRLATETAALMARPRVSLAEQLSAMEGRGFRFTVHKDDLRVFAPAGVMTEADRGLIRENKAAIMAHMDQLAEVF